MVQTARSPRLARCTRCQGDIFPQGFPQFLGRFCIGPWGTCPKTAYVPQGVGVRRRRDRQLRVRASISFHFGASYSCRARPVQGARREHTGSISTPVRNGRAPTSTGWIGGQKCEVIRDRGPKARPLDAAPLPCQYAPRSSPARTGRSARTLRSAGRSAAADPASR